MSTACAVMTDRERFGAVMSYREVDRVPAYYFGLWEQTRSRWLAEGLQAEAPLTEQVGLDPDWEQGLWNWHGLTHLWPVHHGKTRVLEETDSYKIIEHASGMVTKESKLGASIEQHIRQALQPTREAWSSFKKRLDPDLPERRIDPVQLERTARARNESGDTVCLLGGSLFGWPRDWMGIEALSMLAYDDPALYEEIIDTQVNLTMRVLQPVLKAMRVDFVYFFEDCCGKSGPLFSPQTYRRFYHRHYVRLVEFFKKNGAGKVMLDSDGDSELLIPCWLESGIDIIFPIEVGTWKADPVKLRREFGKPLRMMGGFNKHLIAQGEAAVRQELLRLKPLVDEGGFIPMPDHRIPPNCSLDQFRTYARVFHEVMG